MYVVEWKPSCVVRLQVSNVPVRDCSTAGASRPTYVVPEEHSCGTWKRHHFALSRQTAGQANRKAGRWRGGIERSEEAKAVL